MTDTQTWPAPSPIPPPPPPPAKKKHKKLWIGLGIFVALWAIGAAMGPSKSDNSTTSTSDSGSDSGSSSVTTVHGHTVTIGWSGTAGGVDLTIQAGDYETQLSGKGNNQSLDNLPVHKGDFVYISAQNTGDYGNVTCYIEYDGVRVKSNTSDGAYTIASCSGRI